MQSFKGIPVSPGIAIGKIFVIDDVRQRIPRRTVGADAVPREGARFEEALTNAREELAALSKGAEEQLGPDAAKIFAFHQLLLADKKLTAPIAARIQSEMVVAEFAVQEQFKVLAGVFSAMKDEAFRTKVDDVWDLERRLLKHLIGEHRSALDRLDHQAIVVATDLTPSQTAGFQGKPVAGFATDMGGLTSHTAIFARALRIPAVVGTERLSEIAKDGDPVIIDGDRGVVILDPDAPTIAAYEDHIKRSERLTISLATLRDLPAVTRDGTEVELLGNVEFAGEVETVLAHGGVGIGLFRSEFLWLTSDHEPTEEEQFIAYRTAIEMSQGGPVTIRTFDLGADKYTQEKAENPERNPFLGLRSIRYCFHNVVMFKRQLRALLRASAFGPVKIMFPLITSLHELRQARMILGDVMEDLHDDGIAFDRSLKVGMMVEVPSAALMAGSFVREVDFFSIGTNDLIQYTLAVDRTNERVQNLYSAANPAVLKLMKDIVRAARRGPIPVSCCGEVAGDPEYTMLLLGLGLRSLSATPSRLPHVKQVVRNVDIASCERLARTACSFDSERQVTAYLRDQARKALPDPLDGRAAEDGLDI